MCVVSSASNSESMWLGKKLDSTQTILEYAMPCNKKKLKLICKAPHHLEWFRLTLWIDHILGMWTIHKVSCFLLFDGLNVGNLNNSKVFMPKVRDYIFQIMLKSIIELMQSAPCFSWVAGKYISTDK